MTNTRLSIERLLTNPSLPVRVRGYDREATDELLRRLESISRALDAERDELLQRLADAEEQLAVLREQEHLISDALLAGERVKERAATEAESMRVEAEQQAAAVIAEAEGKAKLVIRDALTKADEIVARAERKRSEIKSAANETGDRLASFLQTMLERVRELSSDAAGTSPSRGPQAQSSGEQHPDD
jgi:cell division septum initiation protein DivIVA